MDEYTASRKQVETIIQAAQSMKQCLTCSICLDYFEKPVTIKCGHKFCRSCISKVANNDNASCPLCNAKIQKRSIPEESNKHIESCVKQFEILAKAISDDSGIDVLKPCNTIKHSKESVLSKVKPNVCAVEQASISSKGSIKSKVLASKKATIQKKPFTPKTTTKRNTKNTLLTNYLSPKSNYEQVESQDKVENWLKNVESDVNNEIIDEVSNHIEETDNETISHPEDSSLRKNKYVGEPSTSKTYFTATKENCEKPLPHTYPSTSKTITKYKETEMRLQEAEIMAKKKKLNQSLVDKAILKTPSSVPAATHSDAHDWRRVKKVGKEMQVNTFKSLNVSREKSSSSITLDDTVPYNSTNNDSKNISKGSDINANSSSSINVIAKTRGNKVSEKYSKSKQLSYENEMQDQSYNQNTMNSIDLHREDDSSFPCFDKKQVNEVIVNQFVQENQKTPERARNTSITSCSNLEITQKPKCLSPLKISTDPQVQENRLSDEESSNLDSKSTITVTLNSPSKNRLSLKKKFSDSFCSKLTRSHISTPDKYHNKIETPKMTPERPISRLSLKLQNNKVPERELSQTKSPEKNQIPLSIRKRKLTRSPNSKVVVFKKLGKIVKRQKHIPFIKLGRLYSSVIEKKTSVKIIRNELFNINISSIKLQDTKQITTKSGSEVDKTHTISPMEIDDNLLIPNAYQEKEIKNNEILKNRDKAHIKNADFEPMPSTSNFEKTKENINTNIRNDDLLPRHDSTKIKKCKVSNNSDIPRNEDLKNTFKIKKLFNDEDDMISISSNDSESRNLTSYKISKQTNNENIDLDRKTKHSKAESTTSESSPVYVPNYRSKVNKKESSCSSRSSSPFKTSPLKKKRTHSESSNDDDAIVSSIIGKWTTEKPIIKKQKAVDDNQRNSKASRSKLNQLKNIDTDDEKTLVEDDCKEPNFAKPEKDPPIDDIISKVRNFKEKKEDDYSVNKLTNLPSSLQSADLFESNDQNTRVRVEPKKKLNETTGDNSSTSTCSPNKESDKENRNQDQIFEAEDTKLEKTVVDLYKFDRKKSNSSIRSNSSNKENKICNKVNMCKNDVEDRINEFESSPNGKNIEENSSNDDPSDSYSIRDSLINITQEQQALRMIEKDLIGYGGSTANNNEKREFHEDNKFATPCKKVGNLLTRNNDDGDFDSENIDATPIVKKRRFLSKCPNKVTICEQVNSSDISLPEKNVQLIPAVTPMKNTKSYPLCHSTPMINTPSSKKENISHNKPIVLLCSSLTLEQSKIVQNFVKKFKAILLSTFEDDVTHVIMRTNPKTNAGQKTFKYIQGIAYKKYVVNFQWVTDCLNENTILDENDEKYDVLDPDSLECGSRRSRNRLEDVFRLFAFYCMGQFNSIPIKDFKNLLVHNGAVVTSTLKELSLHKDKYRLVILETDESEEMSPAKLDALKTVECAIVSFDWAVDCISQYQIISLSNYLYETSPEEAMAIGIPASFLKEEEEEEEEEEQGEEEE